MASPKPKQSKYQAATVGSFEKEYGIKLSSKSKRMLLSTYMAKRESPVPQIGKLLKAVEKTLDK